MTLNRYVFLLCLCSAIGATLAEASADPRLLRGHLDGIKSFRADFSQRLISVGGARPTLQSSLGRVVFQRPGKFRWVYESPYQQEIVSDGATLWIFDKDLEQVTIRPIGEDPVHSPLSILDNPADIERLYHVELLGADGRQIKLTPVYENPGFKYVVLIFADNALRGMEIYDNFDQYNRLTFHNIETNIAPDQAQFHFTPPDNVDIINAARFE